MNAKSIIARLRQSQYKYTTKAEIIKEIRQLPLEEQREIITDLRIEKAQRDNSDQNDLIDDILDELNPKK